MTNNPLGREVEPITDETRESVLAVINDGHDQFRAKVLLEYEAALHAAEARIEKLTAGLRHVQSAQLTNHGSMSRILTEIADIVSAALQEKGDGE